MPFFEKCIESILNQSYSNWELILVDDFSEDNSLELARSYATKDSRIHLHTNSIKGLIPALQLAYRQSSGDFITRMDADDIMAEERLNLMLNKLNSSGKGRVCVGKVKYFSDTGLGEGYKFYENWLNSLTQNEENFKDVYRECTIPSPNFLIGREDFELIGGFNNDSYPEDYDLTFRMYQHGMKVCSVNEVTHYWRDHASRSTRTQDHYHPLTFIPLKVEYFVAIDYSNTKKLVVWGAGKKGKLIIQELISRGIDFTWVTDNPNKIGKNIYGSVLQKSDDFNFQNSQVIIAVSNREEIQEIETKMSKVNTAEYWCFF